MTSWKQEGLSLDVTKLSLVHDWSRHIYGISGWNTFWILKVSIHFFLLLQT